MCVTFTLTKSHISLEVANTNARIILEAAGVDPGDDLAGSITARQARQAVAKLRTGFGYRPMSSMNDGRWIDHGTSLEQLGRYATALELLVEEAERLENPYIVFS